MLALHNARLELLSCSLLYDSIRESSAHCTRHVKVKIHAVTSVSHYAT